MKSTSGGPGQGASGHSVTGAGSAVMEAVEQATVEHATTEQATVETDTEPTGAEPEVTDPEDAEPENTDTDTDTENTDAENTDPADAEPPGPPPVADPTPQEPPERRRSPTWARVAIAVGVALVLVASGAIGAERFLANRFDKAVRHDTLLAPNARVEQQQDVWHPIINGPLNFLLLGSDARADNPSNGERSDTIIVVHVPASMDRAYLLSIPRDLRVHIPPYAPTGFRGSYEKINGAFQYGGGGSGGVQLLSQTLSNLLGIQFDGAAIIDFSGFAKVVDELGGVDMCVDVRTESIHIGYDAQGKFLAPRTGPEGEYRNPLSTPKVYEPGCRHFVGWEALDYVRQRKTLPNGDYDRQRHQQQFLKAILSKARDRGMITRPLELDRVIRAVGRSLTVDTNGMPIDGLAYALRNIDQTSLTGLTVPSEPTMIGGISYIQPFEEAEALYEALRNDALALWVLDHSRWVNQM